MRNFIKAKKINFKSTFIKLLSSYITLTSVISCVSTIALYNGYKKQVIDNSVSSSKKILEQASNYTNYTLNWNKSFLYQLYLNQDIINLMYSAKNKDSLTSNNTRIVQLSSSNPSIYSIYIYNNNTENIYTSISGNVRIDKFYDHKVLNLLKDSSETFSSKLIPREIDFTTEYNSKYSKNVLTLFLCNNKNSRNSLPDGAIIINLDANEVEKYFSTISENGCDLFAIDYNGNIILHSNSNMFLKNIYKEDYIKSILQNKNSQGSFLYNVDGKPCVITYSSLNRMGLKFIAITPYNTLFESLNRMIHLIVVIFIFIFTIGIVISYIMSKKIYSPLDKIVKHVESKTSINENIKGLQKSNEFDFLSLAIDTILNEKPTLDRLSNEDTNFVKNQLLKNILLDTIVNYKDIKRKFDELKINILEIGNIVIVFKIDNFKNFYSSFSIKDIELIKFGINNICHDIASKYYKNECFSINNNSMVLILSVIEEPNVEQLNIIINFIAEIQKYIFLYFQLSITIGIGSYAYNLSEISSSYNTALDCINYKFKYGAGSILYSTKVESETDYHYDENLENSLFNAVKLGNLKKIEDELDKLLNDISKYSYSNMLLSISQLALHSKKLMDTLYFITDDIETVSLRTFLDNLHRLETLDQVKNWFMNLYSNYVSHINEKKLNRTNDIINSAINYIEENFKNPALSPELIADYVNISPNYLRTLFKNFANKSLSNYISEFRFNKAKILLKTTDLTVSEVSTAVGFINTNYFYTAFKKHHGISPNQYRNNHKQP